MPQDQCVLRLRFLPSSNLVLPTLRVRVLPIRGTLYTFTKIPAPLVAIQVLDGVANCIFVVVSILVIADLTQGTGRFNLAAGAMATVEGIGAALSNTVGGVLIQRFGFNASFAGLALIGALAVSLLFWKVPETKGHTSSEAKALTTGPFALRDSPVEGQQSD